MKAFCKCRCGCKEQIDFDRGYFAQGYYAPTKEGICWKCQWGIDDGFVDIHGVNQK